MISPLYDMPISAKGTTVAQGPMGVETLMDDASEYFDQNVAQGPMGVETLMDDIRVYLGTQTVTVPNLTGTQAAGTTNVKAIFTTAASLPINPNWLGMIYLKSVTDIQFFGIAGCTATVTGPTSLSITTGIRIVPAIPGSAVVTYDYYIYNISGTAVVGGTATFTLTSI